MNEGTQKFLPSFQATCPWPILCIKPVPIPYLVLNFILMFNLSIYDHLRPQDLDSLYFTEYVPMLEIQIKMNTEDFTLAA